MAAEPATNIYAERIAKLRSLGYDALIISGTDPHSSEYPAPRWQQVKWASGFTGETGDIVVTADHAGLWTDTRYFIQAVPQLKGSGIELHKTRVADEVLIPDWLAGKFRGESIRVGIDGLCQSVGAVQSLRKTLEAACGAGNVEIVDAPDMLSAMWPDRPAIPHTPIEVHDDRYASDSRTAKLDWLRGELRKRGCASMFLTSLEEIAWLLNVRATDTGYDPYVISYLAVTQDKAVWFVRNVEEAPELKGVFNAGYDVLEDAFIDLQTKGRMLVDPETLNYHVAELIKEHFGGSGLLFGTSPVILKKGVKTRKEIDNIRRIHIEDGVAMENFLYWLDKELASGSVVDEWTASQKMTEFRSRIEGYRGNSFENISAYGANAALPHYVTPHEGSAVIRRKGLYLIDSGGQYLTGTTDITRTVPVGKCSRLEKEDYTLVLKGMIDLSMAIFPRGTAGCQIDAVAREPLWAARRNFGHGTGHGIGYWLGCHEGPQSIRQNFLNQPLLPGMITSNEPGLYREGRHGIRHENLILCKEDKTTEFGEFLCFETLTLCHIDTSAVKRKLLTKAERKWLKAYNRRVYKTLKDRVEPEVAKWMKKKGRF